MSKNTTSLTYIYVCDWSTSSDSTSPAARQRGGVPTERETLYSGNGNSYHVLKCKSCSVSGKLDIL